jgi:DNA-binding HxlR family transcriptional regulator
MTSGQTAVGPPPQIPASAEEEAADLLRLLGTGASGAILMALGGGALRTKELTERVPGYAPRTVYRYVSKLVEVGALEREEEPGVPSKVVHSLTDPAGVELHDLVDTYARASLERFGNGEIGAHSWGFLALLGDLWESGMFEVLNLGPATATELARVGHGLSFHQVSRRISLFVIGGVIEETNDGGRRRRYALTEQSRRAMALIAGLGRWRERNLLGKGEPGLTAAETAGVLRMALPLLTLRDHPGRCFKLRVGASDGDGRKEAEVVWAKSRPDGTVAVCPDPVDQVDAWGRGKVSAWIEAVMKGGNVGIRVGGDDSLLVRDCLKEMQEALWKRREGQA